MEKEEEIIQDGDNDAEFMNKLENVEKPPENAEQPNNDVAVPVVDPTDPESIKNFKKRKDLIKYIKNYFNSSFSDLLEEYKNVNLNVLTTQRLEEFLAELGDIVQGKNNKSFQKAAFKVVFSMGEKAFVL